MSEFSGDDKRLQLVWIESVLGHSFLACNLLWPCFLIETSDTELSGLCLRVVVLFITIKQSSMSSEHGGGGGWG